MEPASVDEEIVEALWRPYLVFGVPPVTLLQWIAWLVLAGLHANVKWLIAGGAIHAVLFRVTEADFEWMSVIAAYFRYPDDVDP